MPDQAGLGEFEDSASPAADRNPAAEAQAIAGQGAGDGGTAVREDADHEFEDVGERLHFAVTQVDYTIEGSGDDEHPVIHVFGRTTDREAVHVRVHDFDPYFYAPADSATPDRLRSYDTITGWEENGPDGEPYESIRGERLVKIFGQTPRDVGNVRDDFDHYEADILFPNRFLIDHGVTGGVSVPDRRADASGDGATSAQDGAPTGDADPFDVHHTEVRPADVQAQPRVNVFDIEVDDRAGFPEDGEETILCLTSYDSYDDEYVVWLYESPDGIDGPEALERYEPISGDFEADVRLFEREEAMLDAFLTYVERTGPDVLSGWNFDDFDAPYLIDRLENLQSYDHDWDLRADRLSPVEEVWDGGWGGPDVKGRVVFDLLYAYQRTQFSELDSYRLDAVGEEELGVGKERYAGDIGDLWEDDPERLLEYNLRDVELCVELDRDQQIVAFWDEVRRFVGCKLEDATTPGDAVDMYVLHKLHGDFVLPSKGAQSGEEYEGGAVFDPISGVRENVTVLDLKSLYPMCMVTTNASPETKVDPDAYEGDTYRAPNGTHFRKEPDGVIREMVDELLSEREEKKEFRNDNPPDSAEYDRYDRQQAAVKVIMNCFTPDTEVLTPDGVRRIRELSVGDEVYSLDPDTMTMEVKPVVDTHAYPEYDGELVDIQTSKIDFRVTPNHNMVVRKDETNGISEESFGFVEAGDLDPGSNYQLPHDWDGPGGEELSTVDLTEYADEYQIWVRPAVHGHTFAAELGYYPDTVLKNDLGEEGYVFDPASFDEHRSYVESVSERSFVHSEPNRKWIPRTYDGDDFLQFLAWYVAEGNTYTTTEKSFGDNHRGVATTVKIAQERATAADGGAEHGGQPADVDRAAAGKSDCGNEEGEIDDHEAIGRLLDRMGLDCTVDDRSYTFTSKLLGDLLDEWCGTDSHSKRIPEFVFGLSDRQKRLFLETLIDGDGDRQAGSWRYSTASERLRDDVLRLCAHLGLTASYNEDSGTWRIYVTEDSKNTLRMHRSGDRSTASNGVYCVTVADNHTLLAGRNGRFQFVGQSLYGVLGWDRFRLYDSEMGAAVTATGREVIEYTDEVAQNEGYEVVYGDTDSVMLEIGDVDPDAVAAEIPDADLTVTDELREKHPEMDDPELREMVATIAMGFRLEDHINDSYDEFARERLNAETHRFQIEFEKLYRRFFQAGKKKRYAGHIVWKEGKHVDDVDITGFEYQRSDIAPITKRVQKDVIDMIVHGEDVDAVTEYLHEVIEDFKAGNVSLDDVGIPGGIGQKLDEYDTDTAQVRGAKYANTVLGTNFQSGSKPKRVYIDRVHEDFFRQVEAERDLDPATDPVYAEFKTEPDVICFEYDDQVPDAFEVDWDKMLDKTLKGPIERIIEALGVSWAEVESGQEQTGLGEYM